MTGVVIPTTTVTIYEVDQAEPYEAESATTLALGIPAHLSAPSGLENRAGGSEEIVDAVCLLEAGTGLSHLSRISDDADGATFEVQWVRERRGLGLDHCVAGLRRISGTVG